jgi:predicted nucleic acid-binding protein
VRYWDPSAIVATLGTQTDPRGRASLLAEDLGAVTWWASKIECSSALFRLRREEKIDERVLTQALRKLGTFFESCLEVAPSEEVRKRAIRLLRIHALSASDALQLAAALVASREDPASLPLVTSDEKLKHAAETEGFTVL